MTDALKDGAANVLVTKKAKLPEFENLGLAYKLNFKLAEIIAQNQATNLMNDYNISVCLASCFLGVQSQDDAFASGRRVAFVNALIDHYRDDPTFKQELAKLSVP